MKLAYTPLFLASLIVAAAPAHALRRNTPEAEPLMRLERGRAAEELTATRNAAWQEQRRASDAALAEFQTAFPGTWIVSYDERTERIYTLMGDGARFFEDAERGAGSWAVATREQVVEKARAWVEASQMLHGLPLDELVLAEERTLRSLEGAFWTIGFDRHVDGIPVEKSGITLALSRGNLALARFDRLLPVTTSAKPGLSAEEAIRQAFHYTGGRSERDELLEAPKLVFVPEARVQEIADVVPGEHAFDVRLAWRLALRKDASHGTWVSYVDAHTGELFLFYDNTRYATAGRVTARIYPESVEDPEIVVPIDNQRVRVNNQATSTDANGMYNSTQNGTVDFGFRSQTSGFDVRNSRGASSTVSNPGGPNVDLLWTDTNSRKDERNCFHHLTQSRQHGLNHISINWFNSLVVGNVNANGTCNAFWNGTSVNFFPAGGACNNTGEIASIMAHEWGHGIDANNGGQSDGGSGEAIGDIVSLHLTKSHRLGPSFFAAGQRQGSIDDPGTLRDLSKPVTAGNIAERCTPVGGGCRGPLNYECHCEGQVFAGTSWMLARLLRERLGDAAGWDYAEKLFYVAMPNWGNYTQAYGSYLAVDDTISGDGNPANGTPNGCLIYEAFNTYGIAGANALCQASVVKLALVSATVDDAAAPADADMTADPGETFNLVLRVSNAGNSSAPGTTATVTTGFPGVTISGTATFPTIFSPAQQSSMAPQIQVTLDPSVPCGVFIPFDVRMTSQGMTFQGSFRLRVGKPSSSFFAETFEAGAGGFTGNTGSNTSGNWLRGTPRLTASYGDIFQPGSCAQGTQCYYTGTNSAWDQLGTDDVDGGSAIAESPVFSLVGAQEPVLTYSRWFVSHRIPDQPADTFEVRISNGTASAVVQTVRLSKSSWITEGIPLKGVIPFTATMRLQFVATDDPAAGSIVEGAVDDIRVEEFDCRIGSCATPTFQANSLRAKKSLSLNPVDFSWMGSGSGSYNVHYTDDRVALPGLWMDLSKVIDTVPGLTSSSAPPPTTPTPVAYYFRTFAADCAGNSVP